MELTVKTTYKDDLRRFRLADAHDWNLLCTTISKLYGLEFFSLRYQDDEGDIVTVTSPLEYEEAIRLCSNPAALLKLLVSETDSSNAIRFTTAARNDNKQSGIMPTEVSPATSKFLQLVGRVYDRDRSKNYFRDVHSFEERKGMADRVKINNSESVPVIVERVASSTAPAIERCKYLINKKTTVQKFLGDMHTLLRPQPSQPLHFFVAKGGCFSSLSASDLWLARIYEEQQEDDGFLYITYSDSASLFSYA